MYNDSMEWNNNGITVMDEEYYQWIMNEVAADLAEAEEEFDEAFDKAWQEYQDGIGEGQEL